jgi:hypothetical protein
MPNANFTQRFAGLEQAVDDLMVGMFRAPTGPATIRGKAIKPKNITAGLIDVSNLQAVNSKTGNLSVTGNITMATAGAFSAGQTAYDTGVGFWLEYNAGTPRFSLGNSGGNKLTWNGTTLSITGSITASSGTIGGFTIGAQDLTAGVTTSQIGFSSSGSVRIWSGSDTPSAAPFQVSSSGGLTATSVTLKSSSGTARVELTSANGLSVYDSGGTLRARQSIDGSGFLGSTDGLSTSAAVRWTTAGVATINASQITTGSLAFASGGTMNGASVTGTFGNSGGTLNLGALTVAGTLTLGSGGKITDADGSYWDQSGLVLKSGGVFGDSIKWTNAGADAGSIFPVSGSLVIAGTSSYPEIQLRTNYLDSSANRLRVNSTGVQMGAKLFPGFTGDATQSTYYIDAGASGIISNGIGIGGMLGISSGNTINLIAPGTGGSSANWSTFTVANIPDKSAGYFLIQIAGTNYRVPIYANG